MNAFSQFTIIRTDAKLRKTRA